MFVKFCEAHGKLTGSSLTGDRWELIMGALRELSGSSSQLRIFIVLYDTYYFGTNHKKVTFLEKNKRAKNLNTWCYRAPMSFT